ncbi:MAG: hypothetical protein OXB94_05320, partial [Nitrospira sp.]|nr:hypothetical protein [Nitrospira sp.]
MTHPITWRRSHATQDPRPKTQDKTLYRNYVRKWKFLIQEYELVKQKRHPKFRFVADFYRFHQTHR